MAWVVALLGLALLMVVHEAGHYFAARRFGMRVKTFSIGFGPTLFKLVPDGGYYWCTMLGGKLRLRLRKHAPSKHTPTVFQLALIPFLAYVQIAGMNPFEEIEPEDKGSYANASLFGRITTIMAGPLANYLFASVFFFFAFYIWGVPVYEENPDTTVVVEPGRRAHDAGMQHGDRIVRVNGTAVGDWKAMAEIIRQHPEKPITVVVERRSEDSEEQAEELSLEVTPERIVNEETKEERGLIGVSPLAERREVSLGEAAKMAVVEPPRVVRNLGVGLYRLATGKEKAELGGVVMIGKQLADAARRGAPDWLVLLGVLSAYLGAFNLIPFPALDGGRLGFLGYELATRRRPNARIEAHIHIVGLVMLLGLVLYITLFGRHDLNLGGR